MTKLKALLFALDNVVFVDKKATDAARMEEFGQLLKFLIARGVRPIVFANRSWTTTKDGEKQPARAYYGKLWGPEVKWYVADEDGFPRKPQAEALAHVLKNEGLTANEVVFLGNDEIDMRVAVNGSVLFLTASWFAEPTEYGFRFDSAKEVARFVDLFCLRDHLWFYEIPEIELRCLGLMSNQDESAVKYTADAINTLKHKDKKHLDFWTKYLISTLYFAGMHDRVDFIAPYPSHNVGYGNPVLEDALMTFAKCFRVTYCPDLIVRHTAATKSQTARIKGIGIDHRNQLNTIQINPMPKRNGKEPYKNSPFDKPRSILVVDDFTTQGYGLDSARAYLKAVPKVQDVFLVSLGRFPNRNVHELSPLPKIKPFGPNQFNDQLPTKTHIYSNGVKAQGSAQEIADHFKQYDTWDWPK